MFRPGLTACRFVAALTLFSLPALTVYAGHPKPPTKTRATKPAARTVPARSSARPASAKSPKAVTKKAAKPTKTTKTGKPTTKPAPKTAPKPGLKAAPKRPSKYPLMLAANTAKRKVRILPAGFDAPPPTRDLTALVNGPVEIVAHGKGRINYEVGIVKAVGLGAIRRPSIAKSRGQDVLEAREAAIADAIRILSMTISEVRVTSETRVKNFVLEQDEIRLKVAEYVRGAEILEEKLMGEVGIYRVVVQTKLTGPGSLQEALAPKIASLAPKTLTTPEPEQQPKLARFAPGMPAPEDAEYTCLIVDCRGLRINSCMSPKLFSMDGSEVYGTMKVSADYVIEHGIAAFPRSMDAARNSTRAGDRPLIVRAQRVADKNRFYPVISQRDAERARSANESGRFFERTAVIFVVDPID